MNHNKFYNNLYSSGLIKCIFILGIIQIIFFLITSDNHFNTDDYRHIIGLKLYNLIQGHFLSLENIFLITHAGHYVPSYHVIYQFMPDSYVMFHGVIVVFHFISSILVFLILKKLTNDRNVSLLSSIIYSVNYSIHIKALNWNAFGYNMVQSLTGFLSILFLLLALEKNKYSWLLYIAYIIFSLISVCNWENGLIYPFISLLILILFYRTKINKSIIVVLPVIIFFLAMFTVAFVEKKNSDLFKNQNLTNEPKKVTPELAIDRLLFSKAYSKKYAEVIDLNSDSYIYYYRSQFAPRDLLGYSLRALDNMLITLNLAPIEIIAKSYFNKKTIKTIILNNKIIFLTILLIIFFIGFFYFFHKKKLLNNQKYFFKFLIIYLAVYLVYTLIFFRRDLNIALAFPSSLIISSIILNLYNNKNKILSISIATLFFTPSILYALTGFEFYGDFSRSKIKRINQNYYQSALSKSNNIEIYDYGDFKYLYYYLNFEENKQYLNKYKNLNFKEFYYTFRAD